MVPSDLDRVTIPLGIRFGLLRYAPDPNNHRRLTSLLGQVHDDSVIYFHLIAVDSNDPLRKTLILAYPFHENFFGSSAFHSLYARHTLNFR